MAERGIGNSEERKMEVLRRQEAAKDGFLSSEKIIFSMQDRGRTAAEEKRKKVRRKERKKGGVGERVYSFSLSYH